MSRIVSVSVPATSANLGPGYDALGLALEIRDFVTAQFTDDNKITVEVTGQGAGKLPTDETHLIAKTIIDACRSLVLKFQVFTLSAKMQFHKAGDWVQVRQRLWLD